MCEDVVGTADTDVCVIAAKRAFYTTLGKIKFLYQPREHDLRLCWLCSRGTRYIHPRDRSADGVQQCSHFRGESAELLALCYTYVGVCVSVIVSLILNLFARSPNPLRRSSSVYARRDRFAGSKFDRVLSVRIIHSCITSGPGELCCALFGVYLLAASMVTNVWCGVLISDEITGKSSSSSRSCWRMPDGSDPPILRDQSQCERVL